MIVVTSQVAADVLDALLDAAAVSSGLFEVILPIM